MMQARKIKYDIIGLTEIRRHRPLHDVFETGEELFLGTCDSRGVGGVGVLVNTHLAMNTDSYESLTIRIGRLRSRSMAQPHVQPSAYAPTSSYDEEELEAFYMDLEKLYREDHTFLKVIVGDFNAKIGPRRTTEELHIGTHGVEWNEQGERLYEFIMSNHTIHGNSQFQLSFSIDMGSPGRQFHNEVDHTIVNRKFCLTDVAVVQMFYTGSDHRLLRARFRFSVRGESCEVQETKPQDCGQLRSLRFIGEFVGRFRQRQHRRRIRPARRTSSRLHRASRKSQRGQETSLLEDS
ncbi:unnamed protein product [Haemonchus placei]|uniref:Endo/exonuclease/phosphatase domain-containing protein n=1 Tax=Haemonchus placei TaxID=6290 RepID=A0A0N4WT40_HAEPC|nr:unnamed protein product [Haemonchus placei]